MVVEGEVLGGIEHLEQRGGRIPPEVAGQLVDLVEHEDRIAAAGFLQTLDDPPRQGPDIGPPVAADFRLVMDAAQRNPHEIAVHRPCDRLTERGLSHPRRSHQTKNRRLAVITGFELKHRKKLQNPLLHIPQPVVVGFQDPFRLGAVESVLGELEPRHIQQPVQIGDVVLGSRLRNHLQPGELLAGHLQHLRRQFGRPDPGLQLHDVGVAGVLLQLLLNRPQLFPQEGLPLLLPQRFAHVVLDFHPHPDAFNFAIHQDGQQFEPRPEVAERQQQHLLQIAEIQRVGHQVAETARRAGVQHRDLKFLGNSGKHPGQLLKQRAGSLDPGADIRTAPVPALHHRNKAGDRHSTDGGKKFGVEDPANTAHQNPDGTIGELQLLDHPDQYPRGGALLLLKGKNLQ